MAQQKKKNQAGLLVALWILLALVLLIAFLIKQDDILATLKKTGFFKHTIGTEPTFITNYEPPTKPQTEEIHEIIEEEIVIPVETETPKAEIIPETAPPTTPVNETESNKKNTETNVTVQEQNTTTKQETENILPTVNTKLWFVKISGNGIVQRQEVTRNLTKTNSPLTTALQALLAGPTIEELDKECMTLIPEGSRLLSASVKNKIATLNFSEEFEFNRYGVEGYIGQLMQVVYTATAFPTVESVQFLVEGQRKEYIGSEGVWIGSPLSQSSFK